MKIKKLVLIPILAILCMALYAVFANPVIETRTWVLSYAQQAEAPFLVIAHNVDQDVPDDESSLFKFSKPVELICEAKNGKLVLTDKTNEKTYEGTYKVTSLGGFRRFSRFKGQRYTVSIEGVEGTANIRTQDNRTLFMSIDNYCLNFNVK